jgi:hypothetical protein
MRGKTVRDKINCSVKFEHRCTRVENPGEGVPNVFCQNP